MKGLMVLNADKEVVDLFIVADERVTPVLSKGHTLVEVEMEELGIKYNDLSNFQLDHALDRLKKKRKISKLLEDRARSLHPHQVPPPQAE